MKNIYIKQLTFFIVFCFSATFFIDYIIYTKGGLEKTHLVALQMLMPALTTIIVLTVTKDRPIIKMTGIWLRGLKFWLYGYAIILLCVLLAYLISALFIPGLFNSVKDIQLHILSSGAPVKTANAWFNITGLFTLNTVIAPLVNLPIFLGEEIGWRAFMMPRLLKLFPKYAFVTGGIIWALWHSPIIAMGHNYPGYPIVGSLLFILFCIPAGYVFYYFYKKSGSVVVPALLHGVLNHTTMTMLNFCVDEKKIHPIYFGAAGITGITLLSIAALLIWRYNNATTSKSARATTDK